MVDTTDLIFDEDFLNEFENEEDCYLSQINIGTCNEKTPLKRRKLSLKNSTCIISPESSKEDRNHTNNADLSSRKNRVLDIFATNNSTNDSQPILLNIQSQNEKQDKQYFTSTQLPLKSLNLESASGPRSHQLKASNEIRKINTNKVFIDPNNSKLKSPRIKNISVLKSPPKELQTVIRKFPGPAGLLPDKPILTESANNLNYLYTLDGNEQNNSTSMNESRSKDFCTQDTKKLFSHGSWQTMINDLPKNFLQNYDIMSAKISGVEKIPFLAGVVQNIDYNTENPRVLLKDMSDTIEGVMHRDVPGKFPNILQPGVVILLKEKKKNWRRTKLLFITTKTILGIYGENSRLVSTPMLDAILKGDIFENNIELHKVDNVSFSDRNEKIYFKKTELTNSTMISVNETKENYQKKSPVKQLNKRLIKPVKNTSKNFDDAWDCDFDLEDFDICNENPFDESQTIENLKSTSNILMKKTAFEIPSSSSETKINSMIESQSSTFGNDLLLESESEEEEILSQIDLDANTYK